MGFISKMISTMGGIVGTGARVTSAGLGATSWMVAHPRTTISAALGVAGTAFALQDQGSPTMSGVDMSVAATNQMEGFGQLDEGLVEHGGMSPGLDVRNRMMAASTSGLVQALHNRRH